MDSAQLNQALDEHIRSQSDPELLLLKGHLILELCLNEFLLAHIPDPDNLDKLNLTFARKLDLINALGHKLYTLNSAGSEQIRELNRIRNKLAHTLDFSLYEADFKKWACSVVGYTPKTLNRRPTYIKTVRKAFYILTAFLAGVAITRREQVRRQ
jgi:hypothetical protein